MKLTAQKRELSGKKVKNLRKNGLIPASVFGPKKASSNLQVNTKDFSKLFKEVSFNKFFDLEIENEPKFKVLIKEVQKNPVTDQILSAAFYQVAEDRKITVDVPLRFIGESMAVKQNLGFLIAQYTTIKLNCFPKDLPSEIVVDLVALETPTDTILVSSIKLEEGVTLDSSIDPESAIAYIGTAQKEEALEAKSVEATPVVEETVVEGAVAAEGAKPEESANKA